MWWFWIKLWISIVTKLFFFDIAFLTLIAISKVIFPTIKNRKMKYILLSAILFASLGCATVPYRLSSVDANSTSAIVSGIWQVRQIRQNKVVSSTESIRRKCKHGVTSNIFWQNKINNYLYSKRNSTKF